MRNPKLVLVLNLDSNSENVSVGPVCNPWPIQLYRLAVFLTYSLTDFKRVKSVRGSSGILPISSSTHYTHGNI